MKNDHGGFEPPMAPSAPSNKEETIISKLEAIKKRIEDREQKTSWEDTQQTLRDLTVKYQLITSNNDHGSIVPPTAPSAPSNKDEIFISALNIFEMSISLRKVIMKYTKQNETKRKQNETNRCTTPSGATASGITTLETKGISSDPLRDHTAPSPAPGSAKS